MQQFNMHHAKTHLSSLVEQALSGKEVVIAKANKPLVKLIPFRKSQAPRKPGRLKGTIVMSEDFNDESSEINAMFYGTNHE